MKQLAMIAALSSSLVFSACEAPPSGVDLSVQLKPVVTDMQRSFSFNDNANTTFTIESARIMLREVNFDMPQESSKTGHQKNIEGPFVVNLLTGQSTPAIERVELQPGKYDSIELRIMDATASDLNSNDQLIDYSLHLSGRFNYLSQVRNFTILVKINEWLDINRVGETYISDGLVNDFVIEIDPSNWISSANIKTCVENNEITLESDGSLIVNDTVNSGGDSSCDLAKLIKQNIKNSSRIK